MPAQTYTGYECPNCKKIDRRELEICPSCGFPKKGTESQKETFYNNLELVKKELVRQKDNVFQARLSLWAAAILNFLFAIVFYFSYHEMEDSNFILTINLLSATLFFLFGLLAKDQPFTALLFGIVLYIALIIFRVVYDEPNQLLHVFTRELFVVWLFKGLNSARVVQDLQKEIARRESK